MLHVLTACQLGICKPLSWWNAPDKSSVIITTAQKVKIITLSLCTFVGNLRIFLCCCSWVRVLEGDATHEMGVDDVDGEEPPYYSARNYRSLNGDDDNSDCSSKSDDDDRDDCAGHRTDLVVDDVVVEGDFLANGYVPDTQFDAADRYMRIVSEMQSSDPSDLHMDVDATQLPEDYYQLLCEKENEKENPRVSSSNVRFAQMASSSVESATDANRSLPSAQPRPVSNGAPSVSTQVRATSTLRPTEPAASSKQPAASASLHRQQPVVARTTATVPVPATKKISPPPASAASIKGGSSSVLQPQQKVKNPSVGPAGTDKISKNKNSRFTPPARVTMSNSINSSLKMVNDAFAANAELTRAAEEERRAEKLNVAEIQLLIEREKIARDERVQMAQEMRLQHEAEERRKDREMENERLRFEREKWAAELEDRRQERLMMMSNRTKGKTLGRLRAGGHWLNHGSSNASSSTGL
jgi:hypothetical protein